MKQKPSFQAPPLTNELGCGFPVSFEFLCLPCHRICVNKAKNQLNLQEIYSPANESMKSFVHGLLPLRHFLCSLLWLQYIFWFVGLCVHFQYRRVITQKPLNPKPHLLACCLMSSEVLLACCKALGDWKVGGNIWSTPLWVEHFAPPIFQAQQL